MTYMSDSMTASGCTASFDTSFVLYAYDLFLMHTDHLGTNVDFLFSIATYSNSIGAALFSLLPEEILSAHLIYSHNASQSSNRPYLS